MRPVQSSTPATVSSARALWRVGPRFTRAAFPAWQDNRAGNVHVVLAEGTALHLERVTRGGAVFGGAGTVVAGTVAAADALFQADDGTKVVKDAAVPGPLRAERQAGNRSPRPSSSKDTDSPFRPPSSPEDRPPCQAEVPQDETNH